MARQGLLAKAKPSAGTDTLLYTAPVDASASAVLNITAQGGSGTTYDVVIKDYDQKLQLDASTYLLHEGDIITAYQFTLDTPIPASVGLAAGTLLTSTDGESTAKFESFVVPEYVEVDVRDRAIRTIAVESVSGTFVVGDVITKGTSPDTSTAIVYEFQEGSGSTTLYVGPSTLNGSGTEFTDGDSLTATGGATATVSAGGVGTAAQYFTLVVDGGTEGLFINEPPTLLSDRAYRFDVSDASMSGRDFKLSDTVNGEWGPDGDFAETSDNGTEFTTGKTTNGTAGSSGAYVQYDLSAGTPPANLYYYDGGTGTASNSTYGGSSRTLNTSSEFEYTTLFVYDLDGAAWTTSSDGFEYNGTTYTITGQTSGPYGYVRSYSGTDLYVIKGKGSADFAGSDTFQDNPKANAGTRNTVTVSSVLVATTAHEAADVLRNGATISANSTVEIKSLVIGPAQRLMVNNAAADCSFVLIGFEDNSTGFTTRAYATTVGGGAASGG